MEGTTRGITGMMGVGDNESLLVPRVVLSDELHDLLIEFPAAVC
jgi:hypothetical protein